MGRKVSDGLSVKVVVPVSTTIEQGKFYLLDGVLGISAQGMVTNAAGDVISLNGNTVTAGLHTAEVVLVVAPAEYESSQIDVADAFAKGDRVYWDNANARFTTVPTDGPFCGVVTTAKDANNVIWFLFAPQPSALEKATTVAAVAAADVVAVAAADGVAAAGANPTKAEFDAVVTLVNETKAKANSLVTLANEDKAKINAILTALKAANLMA